MPTNKSLGQHWLRDRSVLAHIADCADVADSDTVLEIGPGLGTLTSELLRRAGRVVAVEFDSALAEKLPGQFPGKNLEVIQQDILTFDESLLPEGYKLVANVPYYITSKIVHKFMTATSKPAVAVLLIQKEVAQRLAAQPGDMSVLAVSAQVFADVTLGDIVPAALFTPPPKVDSQVVILHMLAIPRVPADQQAVFFRLVKAGFAAKRKKLRSSLSGGLALSKDATVALLESVAISPDSRAEDLSIDDWLRLADVYHR